MIGPDDIDAFQADDTKLMDAIERWQKGSRQHRRIMANEEDAILSMALHYRTRCFQLIQEMQRVGLESMEPWIDPRRSRND